MDKIRLFLSGCGADFARLYNWDDRGFQGGAAAVSMPSNQALTLFIISLRRYELSVDGDAVAKIDDEAGDETMRFHSVNWSVEAVERGNGVATIQVINPEVPLEPFVIRLTMGEFRYDHARATADESPVALTPADTLGAMAMLCHEGVHAAMGMVISNGFWDQLAIVE